MLRYAVESDTIYTPWYRMKECKIWMKYHLFLQSMHIPAKCCVVIFGSGSILTMIYTKKSRSKQKLWLAVLPMSPLKQRNVSECRNSVHPRLHIYALGISGSVRFLVGIWAPPLSNRFLSPDWHFVFFPFFVETVGALFHWTSWLTFHCRQPPDISFCRSAKLLVTRFHSPNWLPSWLKDGSKFGRWKEEFCRIFADFGIWLICFSLG